MTDFNTEPFFDDYNEDDKFYRILFRPGYAVQARELTQMQTILQEQVRRHGDHIFKEGAMVIPGQVSYDLSVPYVKLVSNTGVDMTPILTSLVNKEIQNSAGLIAKVVTYALAEENSSGDIEENTLFLKYQNSVQDVNGNNVQNFSVGDLLTPVDSSINLNVTVADTALPFGFGCTATVQRGIYYINKNFVLVTDQTIILDKYTTSPSYRIGLKMTEDIVYPEQDEQLLDNALGSPNYAAPGAARYKIDLALTKIAESAATFAEEKSFIDLLRLRDGLVIFKLDRTAYSEIEKTLARRTYDESGDYTLNPFTIQVKEYRNNFRNDWAAGETYIQGDLIRVSDGALGYNYFVATTTGTSGSGTAEVKFANWATSDYVSDNEVRWEYMPYPNFNQGVHTFESGASAFSQFTADDHLRLDGTLALGVEAGKAYVRGYEIEKLSTEYLPVSKSRYLPAGSPALCSYFNVDSIPESISSISATKTTSINMSMGSYIIAEKVKYAPDLVTIPTVNLHSVVSSSAGTGTIIGTASIRAIETDQGDTVSATELKIGETYTIEVLGTTNWATAGLAVGITPAVGKTFIATGSSTGTGQARSYTYKVFLFNIIMNSNKDFSNVKSIYTNATSFSCDMVQDSITGLTSIINPDATSLIYQLPDYAITSISEAIYSVVAPLKQTASSGNITINVPIGYKFESTDNPNNYIVINNETGAVVRVVAPNISISTGATSLYLQGLENKEHTILATLKRTVTDAATYAESKRSVTDAQWPAVGESATTQSEAQAKVIKLNHSYVTRIVSVTMSTNTVGPATTWNSTPIYSTNITDRYIFDGGQDASQIGTSTITLAPGEVAPIGPIIVKYEYLESAETSPGDFIAVDSYTHPTSKMRYDQIPTVSSYPLRDSIDFRPYVIDNAYKLRYFPKYGTTASIVYNNYLSRIDNISLSTTGEYLVTLGIPSENPIEPNTPNLAMKLARANIEPYTFLRGSQRGVAITPIENKRYTMRDIGKLERRIQDLEYYTALTLTELDTKNMRIIDSDGLDRYQNGFLVDSFDGQGVGNSASDDWNASVDIQKKELRPFFSQKQVNLLEKRVTAPNYKVSGDLVTLPFTETEMITQSKASTTESVNPYAVYSWKGIVTINPWSDTWFSTYHRPDIILNDESQYNAIVTKAKADGVLGTVWNSWQTAFSSTKSLATRMQSLGAWSVANNEILNDTNNGGSFWRNRATFTAEELDFIGNTNRDIGSSQANAVAGTRVITIETNAVQTTSTRAGTKSFIVDKVDSRVLEDRVVDTQIVPYIRPRAVLFTGYGFRPSTRMYAFFDNVIVNDYIVPATRLEVSSIANYPVKFDVERNAGSKVSDVERTVWYSSGVDISGTISVNNNSTTVTGMGTSFLSQVQIGDQLNLGDNKKYTVSNITNDSSLTISPAYGGIDAEGYASVIGPQHNTEEVEIAFNHGEVIREIGGNGNTAIVVGQELVGGTYYLYVLNIKGNGQFSTQPGSYLEGEYVGATGNKPRVKFVEKTVPTALTSSATGLLCGIFNIPSSPIMKFRTGSRDLMFSDDKSPLSAVRSDKQSTTGGATYQAQGLIEIMQRTIVSTRTANIVAEQVSATNTIVTTSDRLTRDTGWFDPLAQTFLVQQDGGAFITSADIYFQQADAKIPVRIEIREVVNGYPGATVLPFSRVEKKASEIIVSSDSSAATTFKFSSPVFLQNGVEYALVVLSDSNTYRVWISETLGIDMLSQQIISSQPYSGVLFKSQNGSAWTPDQTQDLKFKIRRAKFSTSAVSIELIPPPLEYANLGFNPFNFITGSRKCRVMHSNHGMIVGEKVMFKSRQVVESINGIAASDIFNVLHTIISAEIDSYVIEFPGTVNSNSTGKVGGGYIAASENYEFQTAMIEIAEIAPPGTAISYSAKVVNHSDESKEYKIIPKENLQFEEGKVYPSDVNYTSSTFPSGLSVIATLYPSSAGDSVSPVIDLGRVAMTMVSNKIDSPDLSINDIALDYFVIGTGVEIGSGKPLDIIDANNDGVLDTLVVNSLSNLALYSNMNNNLQTGAVIQLTYSGISSSPLNMIIIEKYQSGSNLYFTLQGYNGEVAMATSVSQTATIKWLSHFKSEYSAIGGSTTSKYVTKKINFSRPSDMLKIMFSAMIPANAEVEIYYKTGLGVSGDFIASAYSKATPSSYTKSSTAFSEIVADVEGLALFDSVMIKLVMKSINKAMVPRIQDFRVIACAA